MPPGTLVPCAPYRRTQGVLRYATQIIQPGEGPLGNEGTSSARLADGPAFRQKRIGIRFVTIRCTALACGSYARKTG